MGKTQTINGKHILYNIIIKWQQKWELRSSNNNYVYSGLSKKKKKFKKINHD